MIRKTEVCVFIVGLLLSFCFQIQAEVVKKEAVKALPSAKLDHIVAKAKQELKKKIPNFETLSAIDKKAKVETFLKATKEKIEKNISTAIESKVPGWKTMLPAQKKQIMDKAKAESEDTLSKLKQILSK